jgi:acyl-CoA reductase-like NAD-dependent aldehyde dehydrogenase
MSIVGTTLRTISPVDGSVIFERELHSRSEVEALLSQMSAAKRAWRDVPLEQRIATLERFVDAFVARKDEIALELTWQMGRPVRWTPYEVNGFADRARTMLAMAPATLADIDPGAKEGFKRYIRREPLGLVLVLAPWNYPYLTAVNVIVPALAAGNVVLLKHSDQTPLCAERLVAAAREAGIGPEVFSAIHIDHAHTAKLVADARVDHIAFTGSVEGGRAVHQASAGRFVAVGLELGGKDPAYIRADADLDFTVPNVVEGNFFNSGQSCCAVERVYVHASVWDEVVERAVASAYDWSLGLPTDPSAGLGPLVRARNAAQALEKQQAAIAAGARALLDPGRFPIAAEKGLPYLAPQILIGVDHRMALMKEETFGPIFGMMKVSSDEEAIALMNDSDYGLTASIWTRDTAAAEAIGDRLDTGTVFLNRCDYLDPSLAWTGVKNTGRGATLSAVGYEHLTRPKSFHLRIRS